MLDNEYVNLRIIYENTAENYKRIYEEIGFYDCTWKNWKEKTKFKLLRISGNKISIAPTH